MSAPQIPGPAAPVVGPGHDAGRVDARPSTTSPADGRAEAKGAWLRYVPPVAALGTAFVLQVVIVTDTLGGALARTDLGRLGWALGVGFGLSVASCAEGGAAYLMDLYDKHLLKRDSVWVLRLAMLAYVAGSAAVIHWWTGQHHLPAVLSWLLAGMSASALFLWSRGARWRNREQMRAVGQLDPALPRLPLAARLLHPIRAARTTWLISWEPVATTDQARARWLADREHRTGRIEATGQLAADMLAEAERAAAEILDAANRAALDARDDADRAADRAAAERLAGASRAAEKLLSDAREEVAEAARKHAELTALELAELRRRCDEVEVDRAAVRAELVRAEAARVEAGELLAAARKTAERVPVGTARKVAKAAPGVLPGRRRALPVDEVAAIIEAEFPGSTPESVPGRPTVLARIQSLPDPVSCGKERADEAIAIVRARRRESGSASADQERSHDRFRVVRGGLPEEVAS